ncbi:FAD-linked oxidase C-terminal domain-containing protein, partial [Clostridioides difficile]
IKSFGHAGDGNLHIYILKDGMDDNTWKIRLKETFDYMYKKSRELSGQVSGEHGIGYAKKEYLHESNSDAYMMLIKNIKLAFDPKNILNPGKIY